jgi:hypothetical protein
MSSPDTIRVIKLEMMRWVGQLRCMSEMRNAQTLLVGKPEKKRPLRRPGHRFEDNTETNLKFGSEIRTGFIQYGPVADSGEQPTG